MAEDAPVAWAHLSERQRALALADVRDLVAQLRARVAELRLWAAESREAARTERAAWRTAALEVEGRAAALDALAALVAELDAATTKDTAACARFSHGDRVRHATDGGSGVVLLSTPTAITVRWSDAVGSVGAFHPSDAVELLVRLDAPAGPVCGCGAPTRHESGWCGQCPWVPRGTETTRGDG